MTKRDLINNLGTIAKSGTSSFLEKLKEGGAVNLVADKVTVRTKHNDDKQYIWESTADSSFTIKEDPEGNTLGRGSAITLHLKDDCKEFTEGDKIKELVKKYSEFISFPIYLKETKTVEKEVPVEEEPKEEAKEGEEKKDEEKKDELEVKDGDETAKPKTKKVNEEVVEWTQVNSETAIWTRSPRDVEEDEYNRFYNTISKETDGPLTKMHFSAEGEIEFKSILFVPKKAPYDLMEGKAKSSSIKLYVRRVFITDEFEDLMPRWLSFIKGVVDSEDLPLNVSREMLQTSKVLRVIKKKLVTKALEMIRKMAEKKKKKEDKDEARRARRTRLRTRQRRLRTTRTTSTSGRSSRRRSSSVSTRTLPTALSSPSCSGSRPPRLATTGPRSRSTSRAWPRARRTSITSLRRRKNRPRSLRTSSVSARRASRCCTTPTRSTSTRCRSSPSSRASSSWVPTRRTSNSTMMPSQRPSLRSSGRPTSSSPTG